MSNCLFLLYCQSPLVAVLIMTQILLFDVNAEFTLNWNSCHPLQIFMRGCSVIFIFRRLNAAGAIFFISSANSAKMRRRGRTEKRKRERRGEKNTRRYKINENRQADSKAESLDRQNLWNDSIFYSTLWWFPEMYILEQWAADAEGRAIEKRKKSERHS